MTTHVDDVTEPGTTTEHEFEAPEHAIGAPLEDYLTEIGKAH